MAPSIRTTRTTRSSRSKRCSCSTGSHVRMVDAVSIYEPLPPKQTNHTYDGSGVATTKNRSTWNGRRIASNLYTGSIRSRHQCDTCTSCRTGEMASHPHHQYLHNQEDSSEHRTPFLWNRLLRKRSWMAAFKNVRHDCSKSRSSWNHDDPSPNDASTDTSSNCTRHGIASVPIIHSTTRWMMPPSPFLKHSLKSKLEPQPQPRLQPAEPRKLFLEKLFAASRMHVSKTELISWPHQASNIRRNESENVSGTYKVHTEEPLITSRVADSVVIDTTTIISLEGVEQDINDLSFEESTIESPSIVAQQKEQQSTINLSTTDSTINAGHLPACTSAILIYMPTTTQSTNPDIMEVQPERLLGTPPTTIATLSANAPSMMRVTEDIPLSNQYRCNSNTYEIDLTNASNSSLLRENSMLNVPPVSYQSPNMSIFSLPLEHEMSAPRIPVQLIVDHKQNDSSHWSCMNPRSDTLPSLSANRPHKHDSNEWTLRYYETILDHITNVQCIMNCSDIYLARCDDKVEDFVASMLNISTNNWSGKHQCSAHSLLNQNDRPTDSSSIFTDDDYYEDDDIVTYYDGLVWESFFNMDNNLENENACTILENVDEHQYPNDDTYIHVNMTKLPLRLQRLLLRHSACTTGTYMRHDAGQSFISQNRAVI